MSVELERFSGPGGILGNATLYSPTFYPRHFNPDTLLRHFTPCIDTVNLSNLQEINGGKVSYPATVYPLFKDQFYSYDTFPPSVLASNVL